jgi:hypothetical protein
MSQLCQGAASSREYTMRIAAITAADQAKVGITLHALRDT